MQNGADLNEIERRAYRTIWEDGLLDLFVGVAMVALAFSWITEHAVLGAVLPALMVPLWSASRKRWIEPRAGYVEFSTERQAWQKRNLGLLLIAGVLTLALGVATFFFTSASPPELESLIPVVIPALPAVLLGFGGALVGLLFRIERFLIYALLLFAGGAAGAWFGVRPGWHFLIPGLIVLAVGAARLVSFLKKHPTAEVGSLP